MSTKHEFRCLTCVEPLPLGERSNHCGEEAARLLKLAPALAALGLALREPGRRDAVERIAGLDALTICDLAGWFAAHAGHDVRLFTEYGEEWGSCGEMIQCSGGCGHWRHCALPPKHEGDHRP